MEKITFYCELCDKAFKNSHVFSQDLHIRRVHDNKIIGEAVKRYTRIIMDEMQ
jgi:hypothetical protein